MYKIFVMNLGSTSTKVAYYEDGRCLWKENLEHPLEETRQFAEVLDQFDYRRNKITAYLKEKGVDYTQLDAVVSRGGHTRPIEGGTYEINKVMLDDVKSGQFGRHATDCGVLVAYSLASEIGALPLVVDPSVTDEFEPLARYTGLPEMQRRSSFHALNHRACAKQFAKDKGLEYEKLNLIVAHMGGGVTVSAHKQGRMIDANNGIMGDGPFSSNRTGTLPVGDLVDMCFSGEYTRQQVRKKLNGNGGMIAYVGESDMRTVENEALAGNRKYKECYDAMLYQVCKEIGSLGPVLFGKVDAILLTGGVIFSEYVQAFITERTCFIAPVHPYPGEFEMQALAAGAYGVLNGSIQSKVIGG